MAPLLQLTMYSTTTFSYTRAGASDGSFATFDYSDTEEAFFFFFAGDSLDADAFAAFFLGFLLALVSFVVFFFNDALAVLSFSISAASATLNSHDSLRRRCLLPRLIRRFAFSLFLSIFGPWLCRAFFLFGRRGRPLSLGLIASSSLTTGTTFFAASADRFFIVALRVTLPSPVSSIRILFTGHSLPLNSKED